MKSRCCYAVLFVCSLLAGNVLAQSATRVPVESSSPTPIIQEANPSDSLTAPADMSTTPAEMSTTPAMGNAAATDSSCACNSGMSYSMDSGCNGCGMGYGYSDYSHGFSYDAGHWGGYSGDCGCTSGFGGFWGHRRSRTMRFGGWRFGGSSAYGCGCGF